MDRRHLGTAVYRAAVLAWRKAEIEERSRHPDIKLANPHIAEHAAALAVHELAPEMTFAQAHLLAQKATNWAAQAHHKWFWHGFRSVLQAFSKLS
jgi:hypothetical protein